MIQIKMIRGNDQQIEVKTSQFLREIGSTPGFKVDLKDIKLSQDMKTGEWVAMVIYNRYQVPMPPQGQTKP